MTDQPASWIGRDVSLVLCCQALKLSMNKLHPQLSQGYQPDQGCLPTAQRGPSEVVVGKPVV